MRTWLRMFIIVVTVGGGFTGFALTTQFLLAGNQGTQRGTQVVLAAFAVLYAFVVAAGLLFVHDPRRLLPVVVAVGLQVPFFSSPVLSYRFSSGAHGTVGIVGGNLAAACRIGSDFQFTLLQPQPWGIGVNVFALVLLLLIVRARLRDEAPARAPST